MRRSALLLAMMHLVWPRSGAAADRLFVSRTTDVWRFELPSSSGRLIGITRTVGGSLGAACSPDEHVYFSGEAPNIVFRWDQDGGNYAEVAMPFWPPSFRVPHANGLAFDAAGDLWINTWVAAGVGAGAWRLDGGDLTRPPQPEIPAWAARGHAAAIIRGGPHRGALLLDQADERRVYISEPPGAPLRVFLEAGAFLPRPAAWPAGITTNACGEVFVGYCMPLVGCGIGRFDPEGVFVEEYLPLGSVLGARALDFDSDGNLYVAGGLRPLWKIAPDRSLSQFWNSGTQTSALTVCRDALTCSAGASYHAECAGPRTCLDLAAAPARPCAAYRWTSDCPGADFGGTETSPTPRLCLDSTGCSTRCTASLTLEEELRTASCTAEVVVEDRTAPVIDPGTEDLVCLWPPNHWYVCLDARDLGLVAQDQCNDAAVRFAGCVSDQPDDGLGDGNTSHDCVISDDRATVCVRAERAGGGPGAQAGRRYLLTAVAEDGCGNAGAPVLVGNVWVPHDDDDGSARDCLRSTEVGCRPNELVPCARR